MEETIGTRIARLAADARSGASELVPHALAILEDARASGGEVLRAAARGVVSAQPSMAPLWNAALAALRDERERGTFERFVQRSRRAGDALVRVAGDTLAPSTPGQGLAVATCSFSGSVLRAVRALADRGAVSVACSEGRPACEGRRLAEALAAARIPVEFFTDAALGDAVGRSDLVLVGADAIGPHWFVNKTGTRQLAAAATHAGVPVYVLAARDKFLAPAVASLLSIAEHDHSRCGSRRRRASRCATRSSSASPSTSSPPSSPTSACSAWAWSRRPAARPALAWTRSCWRRWRRDGPAALKDRPTAGCRRP